MRDRKRPYGFTLLELLLSLSILSIIMVSILGALRIGVRAWEKGENVLFVQQRSRTILDRLTRQLGSATVLMGVREEQPLVTFAGDSRIVEFTSSVPLIGTIQWRPVHVKYVIDPGPGGKKRLLLYEKEIALEDYLSGGPLRHDTNAVVVVGGIEELLFEYLDGASHGPALNWASSWQPQNVTDLPRAVRITYRDEKEGHTLQVIARIHQSEGVREET